MSSGAFTRDCGTGPRRGSFWQKGHALWASAFCPEAAAEIVDFLQWRQEGWVMLCPTLTALWREKTGKRGFPWR